MFFKLSLKEPTDGELLPLGSIPSQRLPSPNSMPASWVDQKESLRNVSAGHLDYVNGSGIDS